MQAAEVEWPPDPAIYSLLICVCSYVFPLELSNAIIMAHEVG